MFANVLSKYEVLGLVERNQHAGEDRWRLSASGNKRLLVGHVLANPVLLTETKLCTNPKDMSTFECFLALERDGWECKLVDADGRLRAKSEPYRT
jgi:hypothetical protein